MAKKRPYSLEYTALRNPRRYLLSGIPPTLWERVRAQARREHIAVRPLILQLLEAWVDHADVRAVAKEVREEREARAAAPPKSAASPRPGTRR